MSQIEPLERHSAQNKSFEGVQTDTVFSLLSNSRRRFVLQALDESDPPLSFRETVDKVSELEYSKDISEISSSERQTIHTSLYQNHLQKLDKNSIIVYDRDAKTISKGENFTELLSILENVCSSDKPQTDETNWKQYLLISNCTWFLATTTTLLFIATFSTFSLLEAVGLLIVILIGINTTRAVPIPTFSPKHLYLDRI